MSQPLHAWPAPAYETRSVACPTCQGTGESGMILRPGHRSDGQPIDCHDCGRTGTITVRLLPVDAELERLCPSVEGADYAAWWPAKGWLAALDGGELASGEWLNPWAVRDDEDEYLVGLMGDL